MHKRRDSWGLRSARRPGSRELARPAYVLQLHPPLWDRSGFLQATAVAYTEVALAVGAGACAFIWLRGARNFKAAVLVRGQ